MELDSRVRPDGAGMRFPYLATQRGNAIPGSDCALPECDFVHPAASLHSASVWRPRYEQLTVPMKCFRPVPHTSAALAGMLRAKCSPTSIVSLLTCLDRRDSLRFTGGRCRVCRGLEQPGAYGASDVTQNPLLCQVSCAKLAIESSLDTAMLCCYNASRVSAEIGTVSPFRWLYGITPSC